MSEEEKDKAAKDSALLSLVELVRQAFGFKSGAVVFTPETERVTHVVFSFTPEQVVDIISDSDEYAYDIFNYTPPKAN